MKDCDAMINVKSLKMSVTMNIFNEQQNYHAD